MADDKQKHLVFSILEFLQASLNNGTIKEDDSEGIEGKRCWDALFSAGNEKHCRHISFCYSSLFSFCFEINPNSCHSVHRRGLWR